MKSKAEERCPRPARLLGRAFSLLILPRRERRVCFICETSSRGVGFVNQCGILLGPAPPGGGWDGAEVAQPIGRGGIVSIRSGNAPASRMIPPIRATRTRIVITAKRRCRFIGRSQAD